MPTTPSWGQVLLRLSLAAAVGIIIGVNRGHHGRAAGLRTTLLVAVAAALAMVLANYMSVAESSAPTSGAMRMDPMRLPLGILSGMGFLGAGVILRRGAVVRGVTTAATLWYVTVLGLCLGAGYITLGLVGFAIGLVTLWLLEIPERRFVDRSRDATVSVTTRPEGFAENELRQRLEALRLEVVSMSVTNHVAEKLKVIRCEIKYHATQTLTLPPKLISELSHHAGVQKVRWK